MPRTPDDVKKLAKESGAKIVDLRFIDLPGMWQHFSIPVEDLDEDLFTEGIGFDGSSIRGFQQIHESDMLLIADAETAVMDPVLAIPTMNIICNVFDPLTRKPYSRDPRYVAQKAEAYLKSTGLADISYWGPEAEFYMFDSVRYDQNAQSGYYYIDSREGVWNTGRDENPNLGYKLRHKEGYFPVPPSDQLQDIRSEILLALKDVGVKVEVHHHEVGTAGQAEIDMRFGPLVKMADNLITYKYIIRMICKKHGMTATFMPKPLFGDNGSGMHVHQSLWKGDTNIFYDPKGYALLSQTAKYYIGGLLKHAPASARHLRPHHQLLSPSGAGLRSSGKPVLLATQPFSSSAHPGVLHQPQGETPRVPLPRSCNQPVSLLRGPAHGRPGWHQAQDRSRRAHGQGSVRTRAGGSQEDQEHARIAGRGSRRAGEGSRLPVGGWGLHSRSD